jgi:hypothetical protein
MYSIALILLKMEKLFKSKIFFKILKDGIAARIIYLITNIHQE